MGGETEKRALTNNLVQVLLRLRARRTPRRRRHCILLRRHRVVRWESCAGRPSAYAHGAPSSRPWRGPGHGCLCSSPLSFYFTARRSRCLHLAVEIARDMERVVWTGECVYELRARLCRGRERKCSDGRQADHQRKAEQSRAARVKNVGGSRRAQCTVARAR